MKMPNHKKLVVTGFYLALALLLVLFLFSYRHTRGLIQAYELGSHSLRVNEKLDELHAALAAAESGQRGFIITGDEGFLGPYHDAVRRIPQNLRELRELVAAHPEDQRRLEAMEPLVAQKLALLAERVALLRKSERAAAVQSVQSRVGLRLMDEIRGLVLELNQAEIKHFEEYRALAAVRNRQVFTTLGLGSLLSLGILMLVFYCLRREIGLRRGAEAGLRRSEGRFRAFMEHSPAVTFIKDDTGHYLYVNAACERLSAIRDTAWMELTDQELWPPEIAARLRQSDQAVLAENQPQELLTVIPGPDGKSKHILVYKFPVPTENGGPLIGGVAVNLTAQKELEEELRWREAEFRLVVDNLPALVFKGYLDGSVDFFDHKVEEMTGYPKADFDARRRKWPDLAPAEDWPGATAAFIKGLKNRGFYVREYRIRTKTGELIWIQERSHIVFNAAGRAEYVSGVLFDITARKRGEEAVRESEKKYRDIFDNSVNGIFQTTPGGRLVSANPALAEIFGFASPAEMIAAADDTSRYYVDPRERDRYKQILSEQGVVRGFEAQFQRPDGEKIWVSMNARAVRDEGGDILYYEGFCENITPRRLAEESLREREERYRGLFEISPDVVGVTDLDLNITVVNQMGLTMFRYQRVEEMIGKSLLELVDPADHARLREEARQLMETGVVRNLEFIFRRRDGSAFPGEINAAVMRDAAGRLVAFTGTIRDITIRKQALEGLEGERRRLYTLLDGLPASIYLQAPDHSIRFANRRFREQFGDPAGRPCYELIQGRQEPCEVCPPFTVLETGKPQEWEFETPTGRSYQLYDYPFTDIDGSPLVLEMGIDITARKQAEETRRRLSDILEIATDLVSTGGVDGRLLYINRAGRRLLGIGEDEDITRLSIADAHSPEAGARIMTEALPAAQRDGVWAGETLFRRRDGREIPTSQVIVAHKGPGGVIQYLSTIARDITESKLAQEALRESEERFRAVVESAQEAIISANSLGEIIAWNPGAENIFGYPEAAARGRYITCLMPERDREACRQGLARLRAGGQSEIVGKSLELVGLRQDGREFPLELSLAQWRIGPETFYTAIIRDITARKEIEAALADSLEKLHQTLEGTVQALAATVETRDPYTAGHQRRVALLACAIALKMGFSADRLEGLRVMGFIHDLGKFAVPAEILSRPGRLSDYEFAMIKTHPQVGYGILKAIEFPWPVAQAVLQHHERLDGSGYPGQLKGAEIMPEAKILAVADVVEAMSSHRPYRPALGIEMAMAEISRQRGILYDAEVVDICLELLSQEGFKLE